MTDDYRQLISAAVHDTARFVRLTLHGVVRDRALPWRRIVLRPVELKTGLHLQVSRFDATQDITKNYRRSEVQGQLAELLALPFGAITLEMTDGTTQFQITKKGKAIIQGQPRLEPRAAPSLQHNHAKALPLPDNTPDRFLEITGIMDAEGRVRAAMRPKFMQINAFLERLLHLGELEKLERRPLEIVDYGCGSAYLTFALQHYLQDILGIPTHITGVDQNAHVIAKAAAHAQELGLEDVQFQEIAILDHLPTTPPDIVVALHACDTATDAALAQAIRHKARLILAVPCCHQALNDQVAHLAPDAPAQVLRPVLRHGILRERVADLVTDAFRTQLLRLHGYRADAIEFVGLEHTARNVLIRAVKTDAPSDPALLAEYNALQAFWQVRPVLEQLLDDSLLTLQARPRHVEV